MKQASTYFPIYKRWEDYYTLQGCRTSLEMNISVIIPTFNRKKILEKTIGALFDQTEKNFEIIVADDGSSDGTGEMIQALKKRNAVPLKYFKQKNRGQATARNEGIKRAENDIILFIGDDIVPDKNLAKEHLETHKRHPEKNVAVLGFIEWHRDLKITPFMRWMTDGSCILGKYGGHQFAFEKLENSREADYNFFYTSNISLKRSLLSNYRFDTDFQKYGWEDIELGYRLTLKENLKMYYNKKAIGYHYHQMDEKSLPSRMIQIGNSARIIEKKYPELKKVPSKKKQFAFHLLSNPVTIFFLRLAKTICSSEKIANYYYYALSKRYFLQGLNQHPL